MAERDAFWIREMEGQRQDADLLRTRVQQLEADLEESLGHLREQQQLQRLQVGSGDRDVGIVKVEGASSGNDGGAAVDVGSAQRIADLEALVAQLRAEASADLEHSLAAARGEADQLRSRLGAAEQAVLAAERGREEAIASAGDRLTTADGRVAMLEGQLKALESGRASASASASEAGLRAAAERVEELTAQGMEMSTQLELLGRVAREQAEEISRLGELRASLEAELAGAEGTAELLRCQVAEAEVAAQEMRGALAAAEAGSEAMRRELAARREDGERLGVHVGRLEVELGAAMREAVSAATALGGSHTQLPLLASPSSPSSAAHHLLVGDRDGSGSPAVAAATASLECELAALRAELEAERTALASALDELDAIKNQVGCHQPLLPLILPCMILPCIINELKCRSRQAGNAFSSIFSHDRPAWHRMIRASENSSLCSRNSMKTRGSLACRPSRSLTTNRLQGG